ncbi:MAG TPA: hypothetical protein VM802_05340 [Chitinophaga sp.]|uniref:hypothetical protein n=1 Tax=Chitinophaga sp. TaxID=1869181 RepID=UPI002C4437E7|nr:hypothetical protein [Chitinophaga sp.]HVI44267.1 hypothetical protein [Chitinophaga sp.]
MKCALSQVEEPAVQNNALRVAGVTAPTTVVYTCLKVQNIVALMAAIAMEEADVFNFYSYCNTDSWRHLASCFLLQQLWWYLFSR